MAAPLPPLGPHVPPTPNVLPRLSVPETGVPYGFALNHDINAFAQYIPAPATLPATGRGGEVVQVPNPEYEQYVDTRSNLAGAVARYAADSPRNFSEMVTDLSADSTAAASMDPSDPDVATIRRTVEVRARGLLPASIEAYQYDPRYEITTDQLRHQIDTVITQVRTASMIHRVRGEQALQEALPVLQEAARNGMAPYVMEAMVAAQRTQLGALEKSRDGDVAKRQAIVDARYKLVRAQQAAREAAAADVPEFRAPNGLGRFIARAVSGETGQAATIERHRQLDEDARKAHDKNHQRQVDNAEFMASQAARKKAIAIAKSEAHIRERNTALQSGNNALESLWKVMIIDKDASGDPIEPHVVTEFKTQPTIGNFMGWLATAEPQRVASAVDPADRLDAPRVHLRREVRYERDALAGINGTADAYGRLHGLFSRSEELHDRVTDLDNRLDAIETAGDPSLEYQMLYERRREFARLANQASYLYARATSELAATRNGERVFEGRYPSISLIDGGYLMGSGDTARIYWANGDVGEPAVQGEESVLFPAVSCNVDGTLQNHGQYTRMNPEGRAVAPGSEQFPLAADRHVLQVLTPILSRQARETIGRRLANYHIDNPVLDEAANTARRRAVEQATVDVHDAAERTRAIGRYESAVLHVALTDPMDNNSSESYKEDMNAELGYMFVANRQVVNDTPLHEYLMRDRIAEEITLRIADEGTKKKPDAALIRAYQRNRDDLKARTDAFAANPANAPAIDFGHQAVGSLAQARYHVLRSTLYDGTVRLNQSGEVVFISGDHREGNRHLREMLHLPEGEWHFWPDGRSRLVTGAGKTRRVRDFKTTDFSMIA